MTVHMEDLKPGQDVLVTMTDQHQAQPTFASIECDEAIFLGLDGDVATFTSSDGDENFTWTATRNGDRWLATEDTEWVVTVFTTA